MARTAVVWLGHGLRGARWRADSIGVSALHSTAVGRAGGERPIYKRQPATALQRADGIEAWPEGTRAGEGMAWGSSMRPGRPAFHLREERWRGHSARPLSLREWRRNQPDTEGG